MAADRGSFEARSKGIFGGAERIGEATLVEAVDRVNFSLDDSYRKFLENYLKRSDLATMEQLVTHTLSAITWPISIQVCPLPCTPNSYQNNYSA